MPENETTKVAIISSKGTLDMAYPPLILASAAVALDMEAEIFFTFYGLDIIHKEKMHKLKIFPHGNTGMPALFQGFMGTLPGMPTMATMMMKGIMKKQNVMTIPKLVDICLMSGVRMIACQMTIDLFGMKQSDFIDGVEFGGAAMYLEYAASAHIPLFV
jgi:peroxiredoxin family protein